MVIAPYWPPSCWFVAITFQKAWIIFLEQVLFTPCPPFIFLDQAGFYLGYHFTLRKINLTMQIKQIVGKHLAQTACVVKEFGRKVTVESKPRWCVQWLSCFSITILPFHTKISIIVSDFCRYLQSNLSNGKVWHQRNHEEIFPTKC